MTSQSASVIDSTDQTNRSSWHRWLESRMRLRPLQAWRSVQALLANPDATGEVFKIIEALKGGSIARAAQRMRSSETGRALLSNKPSMITVLNDREALRAMTEGSLGRAYLAFVETQDLSADGLVAASEEAPRGRYMDADEEWMGCRLRDIHDLQHVLTGYGRDQLGELCLLGFMFTQTYNRGIRFITIMGRRKLRTETPDLPIDACAEEGRRLGREAAWLPAIPWESRLADSLAGLRQEFRIGEPRQYAATAPRWASHLGTSA